MELVEKGGDKTSPFYLVQQAGRTGSTWYTRHILGILGIPGIGLLGASGGHTRHAGHRPTGAHQAHILGAPGSTWYTGGAPTRGRLKLNKGESFATGYLY